MAVSKAQIKATAKYEAKTYDKTLIRLPKGRLDEIRAHIEPAGESLNGFIGRAIAEAMERDGCRDTAVNRDGSSGAAASGAVRQEVGTASAGRVGCRVPAANTAGTPQEPAETAQGAGAVSLPPDTLETAQRAAGRTGESVAAFVARAVAAQEKRDKNSLKLDINPA